MLLTPQMIEQAAKDIVRFWTQSELPDNDKQKILEMVRDFHGEKNEYLFDQYLSTLADRTLIRHTAETGFEDAKARD